MGRMKKSHQSPLQSVEPESSAGLKGGPLTPRLLPEADSGVRPPVSIQRLRIAVVGDNHFHAATPESRKDDYPETCLRKFEHVVRRSAELGCQALISTGDFCNKPTLPTWYVNRVLDLLVRARSLGLPVYSIPGNHDLPFHQMGRVDESSLGTLWKSGFLVQLDRLSFDVAGCGVVDIVGAGVDVVLRPRRSVWRSVCVDHKYWADGSDAYVLTEQDATAMGHDIYVLGHDHIAYPTIKVVPPDATERPFFVVRPGSMTRATSHFHQVERSVQFVVLEFSADTREIWDEPIPCHDPDEVYAAKVFEPKRILLADVRRFVESINRHTSGGTSVYSHLESMNIDARVKSHVRTLLAQKGVSA